MFCLPSLQRRLSDFASWFGSCQHVCSVTQLSHLYPSSWKCNVPFLSSLHRRLNCLRAPTPVISIENSVFPSFMLTGRPCASHVSSTICNSVLAEFTRDTGLSASNEKDASSTSVTSASLLVIQFRVSCWVCSSIRAFAPEDTFHCGCAG